LRAHSAVMEALWLALCVWLYCIPSSEAAKESLEYFASLSLGLGDPSNFVYFLTVIFFVLVFLTPISAWIYRKFLTKLVKEATARARALSAKIRYVAEKDSSHSSQFCRRVVRTTD